MAWRHERGWEGRRSAAFLANDDASESVDEVDHFGICLSVVSSLVDGGEDAGRRNCLAQSAGGEL